MARHPQDEARSSYHSQPAAQDFVVKVKEWNARHVYNFIRGISSWDTPVTLVDQNSFYVVRDALGFGFGVSPIEEVDSEIRPGEVATIHPGNDIFNQLAVRVEDNDRVSLVNVLVNHMFDKRAFPYTLGANDVAAATSGYIVNGYILAGAGVLAKHS